MRRAIIADIYGNLVALQAVLADIAGRRVDDVVCLGGLVESGPDPLECVDLVREKCKWSLCGDDDAGICIYPLPITFKNYHGSAVWIRDLLSPKWYSLPGTRQRWNWYSKLEAKREENGIIYVHGSPRDPLYEYVLAEDFMRTDNGKYTNKAYEIFESLTAPCFCGHSCRPGFVIFEQDWKKARELKNPLIQVSPSMKVLINVGSVGQPRDTIPASSYVIFDTQKFEVEFCRVAYDIQCAIERFKARNLPGFYWQRLEKGL